MTGFLIGRKAQTVSVIAVGEVMMLTGLEELRLDGVGPRE